MKQCSKCKQNKELESFNKRLGSKDGHHSWCKACLSDYRVKNKEKIDTYQKIYRIDHEEEIVIKRALNYKQNKEKILAKNAQYDFQHKEDRNAYRSAHYKANRERIRAKQDIYYKIYYSEHKEEIAIKRTSYAKANPGKMNAKKMKRIATKLEATPPWLTDKQIKEMRDMYIEAIKRTKETGIKYHVDHIIPLQGKMVRGLHVPWNLQIITALKNLSKGNRVPI